MMLNKRPVNLRQSINRREKGAEAVGAENQAIQGLICKWKVMGSYQDSEWRMKMCDGKPWKALNEEWQCVIGSHARLWAVQHSDLVKWKKKNQFSSCVKDNSDDNRQSPCWSPDFDLEDLHGRERQLTPSSHSLTSTHKLMRACAHPHNCNKNIRSKKIKKQTNRPHWIKRRKKKVTLRPGEVAHACNPNTQETEAGGSLWLKTMTGSF